MKWRRCLGAKNDFVYAAADGRRALQSRGEIASRLLSAPFGALRVMLLCPPSRGGKRDLKVPSVVNKQVVNFVLGERMQRGDKRCC